MNKRLNCVIRNVAGIEQYVPVADVPFLNADETVFAGQFRLETEKDGPSKSHVRTICLPVSTLSLSKAMACVVRQVNGVNEYVPVTEVPQLAPGEKVFVAVWDAYQVKAGPSGSDRRTLCAPLSLIAETTVTRLAA